MTKTYQFYLSLLIMLCAAHTASAQMPVTKDIKQTEEQWLQTLPEKTRDSIVYKEWKESRSAQEKLETQAAQAKIDAALTDPNTISLELSNYPGTELDPRIATLKNLQEVVLARSRKLDLTKLFNLLAKLPNLHILDLSDDVYTVLPSNISGLTNLTSLNLKNNNFKTLPESFSKLQKLTQLNLKHNAYLYDEDVYMRLQSMNVTDLVLTECGYSELNDKIGLVKSLETLSLDVNDIKVLPPSFSQLTHLKYVNLSDNTSLNMAAVCTSLASLPALTDLHLDRCYLSTLPVEIGNIKTLKKLTLSENVLTSLPATIANLTNLEELIISSPKNAFRMNTIQNLPLGFGNLKNLRVLDLSGNQLASLGSDFDGLTNLQYLDLSRNQLPGFPLSITNLTRLQIVNLNGNRISEVPGGISKLTLLDSLYLDGDFFNKADKKIKSLPEDICAMKNLKKLTLKDNVIEHLPNCIGELTSLTWLDLRGNLLTLLPSSVTKLSKLQVLDLKSNDLQGLPSDFSNLHALSNLNIAMNINADYTSIIASLVNMKSLKDLDISYNNITRTQAQPLIDALTGCKIINIDYYNKAPLPTNAPIAPRNGTNYDETPKRNKK